MGIGYFGQMILAAKSTKISHLELKKTSFMEICGIASWTCQNECTVQSFGQYKNSTL